MTVGTARPCFPSAALLLLTTFLLLLRCQLSVGFVSERPCRSNTQIGRPTTFGSMMRRRRTPEGPFQHSSGESTSLYESNDSYGSSTSNNAMRLWDQPSSKAKDKFSGCNVLITGASGGLGRSLAHQMVRCSLSTLILSGRNADKLQTVATECQQIAVSAMTEVKYVVCDLNDPASVDNLGTKALELCGSSGTVDVLINNGGISSRSDFVDTKPEVDEQLMQVNFLSGARLAKRVVPSMIGNGRGGTIIWISSVQGLLGIPSRTSYAASKFAVQGYCEALRGEVAGRDIGVHVVSPGYIRTDLSRSAITGDGRSYGKMDSTTANGEDPAKVASIIVDRVAKERGPSDFVVAAGLSAKVAIWLRLLAPSLLEKMLVKRYAKSKRAKEEEEE